MFGSLSCRVELTHLVAVIVELRCCAASLSFRVLEIGLSFRLLFWSSLIAVEIITEFNVCVVFVSIE